MEKSSSYDSSKTLKFLNMLGHLETGNITEVRIFPKSHMRGSRTINNQRVFIGRTVSGYYNNYAKLVEDIAPFDGVVQVYITLNPVKSDLLARAANRLEYSAEATTNDTDIAMDLWFQLDFDPVRPTSISSSDGELELAKGLCEEACEFLCEFGVAPIIGLSGNGYHTLIRLTGYPNTTETFTRKERLLKFLSEKFSTDKVKLDETTFNPSRIWKLYGTMAVKGDSLPERPHRRATIGVPDTLPDPIDLYALIPKIIPADWRVVATTKPGTTTAPKDTKYAEFDVDGWLKANNIAVAYKREKDGGTIWRLAACVFNNEHVKDAQLRQEANGRMGFKCPHNSCESYSWKDFVAKVGSITPFLISNQKRETEADPTPTTIDVPKQETRMTPDLVFPKSAFHGIFEIYLEAVSDVNEVCDSYHFAVFKTVVGSIIGRGAYLYTGAKVYPNFYSCLIGDTGISRKTTALSMGRSVLERIDANVIRLNGLATPEGLIAKLTIPNDDGDDEETTEEMQHRLAATSEDEGFRMMVGLSEYAGLLKKAKKSSSDGLIQVLTDAFDFPPSLDNPTRHSPLKAVNPCLSIVALSTQSWLEESLNTEDIRGGFANRFCYYMHELTPPVPRPKPVNESALGLVIQTVHDIREYYSGKHIAFDFDDEAGEFVDSWYVQNRETILNERNELVRNTMQRLDSNARKLALLYAILENPEGDYEIHLAQFKRALTVATYWKNAMQRIFGLFAKDDQTKNENTIIERLQAKPRTKRQLRMSISRQMNSKQFNEALEALIKAERVGQSGDSLTFLA